MRCPLLPLAFGLILASGASADLPVKWQTVTAKKGKTLLVTASIPKFLSNDPVATYANSALREAVMAEQARFLKDMSDMDFATEDKARLPYTHELKTVVCSSGPGLVSAYLQEYTWTGGAHPNSRYLAYTFGMVDGKPARLKLANILRIRMALGAAFNQIVLPALNEMKKERGLDQMFELPAESMDNFVATPGGLTWLFSPYEVGSYAEGPYLVKVSRAELAGRVALPAPGKR